MMEHLPPGGRCAVVVPEGALFGSTEPISSCARSSFDDSMSRGRVASRGCLQALRGRKDRGPRLPPAAEGKSAATRRRSGSTRSRTTASTRTRSRAAAGRRRPTKRHPWPARRLGRLQGCPLREAARRRGGRRAFPPGTEEPRCWWARFKSIAGNNFNLAASRYEPQVGEEVSQEDPAELIRQVLAIEHEISAGLEKLLREVEA